MCLNVSIKASNGSIEQDCLMLFTANNKNGSIEVPNKANELTS